MKRIVILLVIGWCVGFAFPSFAQDRDRPALVEAIFHLVPDAEFVLEDADDVTSLVWLDTRSRPTDAAILAVLPADVVQATRQREMNTRLNNAVIAVLIEKVAALSGQTVDELRAEIRARIQATQ